MTISSTNRKAGPFIGNGSASTFSFSFRVFAATELQVVRIVTATGLETNLTLNSHYTVSLNTDQNSNPGGSITLIGGALASGYKLIITSDIANLQPTDLTNQGGFYPEVITDALDRATIQIQQLAEKLYRALKFPLSAPYEPVLPLPKAGHLLGWNASEDALINIAGTTGTSLVDLAAANGSALVGHTSLGAGSVTRTVQSKLREISSRADTGGTEKELIRFKAGGSSSDAVIVNSSVNDIVDNLSAASILGGGSTWDENYIGFGKNRVTFTTTGTSFVWPFIPVDNDLANLRVFKVATSKSSSALTRPSGYTASISGSQVNITLAVALTAGEKLIVEDRAAKVPFNPNPPNYEVAPSYSWIGGGYDNIILNNVMQSVHGAHHRVLGGDHGTIHGGSYGIINNGSYGAILGGTENEIGITGSTSGNVASVVAGGIRNLASGGTSSILGGQSNTASGAQTAICGGTNNLVSGTASFASGRNNTVSGSDSFAFGNGNATSGNYSAVWGYESVVSHNHSYAKGYKATTGWRGQDVRFGYRDGVATNPQREHFYIDLSLYSTGTSSALLQLLDGTTSITPPANTVWKCSLQVVARGGNLKGASFQLDFMVQRGASTTEIVGSVDVVSKIDAGMGTSTNAASVSVAINGSNALEVTVQPRLDVSVGTKWAGVLEVLEVN